VILITPAIFCQLLFDNRITEIRKQCFVFHFRHSFSFPFPSLPHPTMGCGVSIQYSGDGTGAPTRPQIPGRHVSHSPHASDRNRKDSKDSGSSNSASEGRSVPLDNDMASAVIKSILRGQIARRKEAVLPAAKGAQMNVEREEGLLIPQSPNVFVAMRDSALLTYIRRQDLGQASSLQDRKGFIRQLAAGGRIGGGTVEESKS
jgi:hypothetical protein